MATETREIERKYEAETPLALPDLDGLPGVAALLGPDELALDATYFDTPDRRLLAEGITLRRRTGGDDAGWHLKLPLGPDTREELRVPLGRAVRKVPTALASLVRAHARGQALEPVGRLRTARSRWQLVDVDGGVLAEVVLDTVTAQTLGEHPTEDSWQEAEVELVGGDLALLSTVDERFTAAGARRSASKSKIGKLLGTAPRTPFHRGGKVGKKSSAIAVVLDYLREQAQALVANDVLVRRDRPDSVHQMRVATRRLRSALRTYGRIVDREHTRELGEELKWLAAELGVARDTEVMHERLVAHIEATPLELLLGPVRARVDGHYNHAWAQARKNVLAALDGQRYLDLLCRLEHVLREPPPTRLATRPARDVLPEQVARAYRKVAKAVAEAASKQGEEQEEALHEVRKAAKRLRYANEAVQGVFGKDAAKLGKAAKRLQTLLGHHQDAVVARTELRELGVQAHLAGENGFSYGLFLGRDEARSEQARAEVPELWREASKSKLRRWLA
ncbi:inorganic triphosphatase YgiF [Crossiella equi]|uniref:Inorganic triphosphatase YgiF n=1 Tax=Crossiella equi TaxID=130796 RepID=A0ABS5A7L1_9PSEU|nr:CYTH and CHAD domain-containing protein [Crossiella equi]MBP2472582.1 inorganic triphosphatase YgiF [Crossiella equi]